MMHNATSKKKKKKKKIEGETKHKIEQGNLIFHWNEAKCTNCIFMHSNIAKKTTIGAFI